MVQALEGIRILDLSWGIAGPLGVLLLAEHGADVIKVEPPGGDPFRAYDGYTVWNRSRRSVEVDLKSDDGRDAFARLIQSADVVVESFRPGVMDRLGFGYDAIAELNPRAILLSIPAYPDGHRFAQRENYDALVQASSGQMWEQPGWRMGPVFLHMPMPSMGTAYLVPIAILSALHARTASGSGQHVRTSLFQGALLYATQIWQDVEHAPAQFHELMGKSYPPGIHQQMIYECANGEYLHASVMSGLAPIKSQDEILGLEDAPDPFTFMAMSAEDREVINSRRRAKYLEWDRDTLITEMRANNHAVEPVLKPEETLSHPQTIANDLAATVNDPTHGATTQMGIPIHLMGTPGSIKGPQPRVGEHTREILDSLPPRSASPRRATGTAKAHKHALDGVTVIDFGQYLAGPFANMIFADLGANVIKVEPVTGDSMRMASKPFFGCQRGKRSVALNLKDPDALAAAHDLMRGADVVHHNMTRGVATKLGIDYAASRALRDDIIYCNTYAYGLPDPLGHFGGLDPLYQASSGLEYESGSVASGNAPLYYRFGMCDASNALLSAVGVLLALHHRDTTGAGQELWTSLHDGGVFFSSDVFIDGNGVAHKRPSLDKGLHGTDALYRLYATQDDAWICIAAVTDEHWAALNTVLGTEHLTNDPRFASRSARAQHRAQLESLLEPAFRTRTARYTSLLLRDAGVPNELPLDSFDGRAVLHDADNVRLGLVTNYEHPIMGTMHQFGSLIDYSETPGRIFGPPPLVGQHTREVFAEFGIDATRLEQLIAKGTAFVPDAGLTAYRQQFQN